MHARKLPRISDGFNEKHQPHSYENAKYSSSAGKYRYSHNEKSRDSPSSNSIRSSSPDSRSQSPRYHKAASYYKVREKERDRENRDRDRDRDRERERDRDRERERDYRTEYRDRDEDRSPKDRRREIRDRDRDRDRENRGNHDRINSVHKKEEKVARVGDWSEHVSSSRKKYYYNCRTEVSQWEKPQEWLEWERERAKAAAPRALTRTLHDSKAGEKHSSDYGRESVRDEQRGGDRVDLYHNSEYDQRNRDSRKYGHVDMDISSGDSSPPGSQHNNLNDNCHDSTRNKVNLGHPNSSHNPIASTASTTAPTSLPSSTLASSSSSTPLPQLLSLHPRVMSLAQAKDHRKDSIIAPVTPSLASLNHHSGGPPEGSQLEPLQISPNSNCIGGGPPTPTHSENHDGLDIRKVSSPSSSLNSLTSLTAAGGGGCSLAMALKPQVPALTPSLANYYKETLITHVQNWPADTLEKPAQRLSEEAHSISSLVMTRVSAELKMARSLVRLAEIQATLHEQRILFLRAQKQELEDMKAQNTFMSDT